MRVLAPSTSGGVAAGLRGAVPSSGRSRGRRSRLEAPSRREAGLRRRVLDRSRYLAPTEETAGAECASLYPPRYSLRGVSFGGAGIFFWWELGCALWFLEHVDVDACSLYGASGGALAATLLACKVDPFEAFRVASRLSEEHSIFDRPPGVVGVWGDLIRLWLQELLPENAAEICSGHVSVVVTTVPDLKLATISEFSSRECLIDANMASCHIPFLLDGKPTSRFKDLQCIDGSFHDFLSGSNSDVLTCNKTNLVIDYFDDAHLNFKRLDFVALKKPEEVANMIHLGYEYADKLSRTEKFQRVLLEQPSQQTSSSVFLQNSSVPLRT